MQKLKLFSKDNSQILKMPSINLKKYMGGILTRVKGLCVTTPDGAKINEEPWGRKDFNLKIPFP